MADLAERFITEHVSRLRPSTQKEYKLLIKTAILPGLGKMKVSTVQATDIDKAHRAMTVRAPYRANRLTALLSGMFALAIRSQWRPDNPATGVARNDEHRRERYLSAPELPRLLTALAAHPDRQAAAILTILLLTGARKGEVLSMKWDQIDFDQGLWVKPASATKQRALHRVPLSPEAVTLLQGTGRDGPFVFPDPNGKPRGDVKHVWAEVCRTAKLDNLRMHDLRHSFASMLVNSGLSLPVIGALLGHAQAKTTFRYAHLSDDPLRAATARVGKIVTAAAKIKLLKS
jgi:integrase